MVQNMPVTTHFVNFSFIINNNNKNKVKITKKNCENFYTYLFYLKGKSYILYKNKYMIASTQNTDIFPYLF